MRIRIGHIILCALLPLIVLYQYGQSNFVHYHVCEDGKVIEHSHPYQIPLSNEDPLGPGHNHSSSELILLSGFDGAFDSSPLCLQLTGILVNVVEDDYQLTKLAVIPQRYFTTALFRGPPTV